ncbi:type II TA system antitoxin MqsA family protein [Peptostreptococcaceae bacterium AGR-M142]
MEEHEVQTVILRDTEEFKGEEVSFDAMYEYCAYAEEYLETEEMIKANSLAMKDAYREKLVFLTSKNIIEIRNKYKVSQKDFSKILDWGRATITRYENHQVQDRAHDDVLRKIDTDPKWFIQMLIRAKEKISDKAYKKYQKAASEEFRRMKNYYLMDSIQALYANFVDDMITGGVALNLNKVIEIINYYASKVSSLHKVKLMKMLWYGDSVSYKRREKSITGLVYSALPMGAVPEGYEQILDLDGIEFQKVIYDFNRIGYKFHSVKGFEINELTEDEIEVLDAVIEEVGHLNSQEIIDKMHDEDAYKCTDRNGIIPFSYACKLSIS